MSEDTQTPIYLTRYQLKRLNQQQQANESETNDKAAPVKKIKIRSPSSSNNGFGFAKFTRKVDKLEASTNEPKKRRVVKSEQEVKGKTTTRKIKLSADSAETKNPEESIKESGESKIILMSGLDMMFSSLIEEANNRLKKKRKNKVEKKEKDEKDSENSDEESRVNDSDEESDEDYFEIDGLPEEIEYTEEEHTYVKNLKKEQREAIVLMEQSLLDLRKAEIPIRFKILNLRNLSDNSKSNIISRLDHFYTLDSTDNEYHKLSTWVETLEKIPFDKVIDMPVQYGNSLFQVGNFLKSTRQILNDAVFGHEEAKDKIITTIAKQITNPMSLGTCIGIQGPMGNGKTTLVKEGICKAMKRPFAFIALGGMQDSSYMMGHEYTYEGSKPGRIVEILTECGCMNPVIYFDELDKISKCPKGEEIENFLCHLTDTSQNSEFHDKYMSGINFDLSKATFIFSYNDPSAVNPILLDRLYKIKTDGFDPKSKVKICKDYLLPKILQEYNFNDGDIKITEDAVRHIITSCTDNEKGVRNLKRCVESIVSKINVLRFMYPESCMTEIVDKKKAEKKQAKETKLVEEIVTTLISEVEETQNSIAEPKLIESRPIVAENKVSEAVISLNITVKSDTELAEPKEIASSSVETKTEVINEPMVVQSTETKVTDAKEEEEADESQDFRADDIIKLKFSDFKLPYVIDESNYTKFIKPTPINPSISHLYL